MLWGVTLQPGEDYTAVMTEEVRLSMATIECRASRTTVPVPVSHVVITTVKGEFLLCSLEKGPLPQQHLDLILQPREQVTFAIEGTGAVHLLGYTPNKGVVVQDSSSNDDEQEMAYVGGEGSDEPDGAPPRKGKVQSGRLQDEPGSRDGSSGEENTREALPGPPEETQGTPAERVTTKVETSYPSPANGYGGWLAEGGFNPEISLLAEDYRQIKVKSEVRENDSLGNISGTGNPTNGPFVSKPTPMNHRKQLLSPTQDIVHHAKGVFQKLREMPHQCNYCFQEFPSLLLCRQHEQAHHDAAAVVSLLSMENFAATTSGTPSGERGKAHAQRGSRLDMVVSRIAEHKQNNNNNSLVTVPRRISNGTVTAGMTRFPYGCKFCGKLFARRDTRSTHERLHSVEHAATKSEPEERYLKIEKAEVDGFGSDGDASAVDGVGGAADDSKTTSGGGGGGFHYCKYCRKPFSSRSKLTIHERKHTGERPYKCRHCLRAFAATGDCRRHEQLHTEEGQSTLPRCRYCSKPFYSISKCLIHERIHTGEKPYQCRMCDNTFSQKGHLTTHERTHTGERPYTCQYCQRGFSTGSGRKKHEKLHRKGVKLRPPLPSETTMILGASA